MTDITSTDNPRVKQAKKLYKARERKKQTAFLIEGAREVSVAARNGVTFRDIFVCPEYIRGDLEHSMPSELEHTTVSSTVFDQLAYREDGGEGIIAVGETYTQSWEDIPHTENTMLLVLDNVEKPGNLGALLRTASAAGVSAVIVNEMQTDILNPNVVRASLGSVFEVPVIRAERERTREWLAHKDISVYATSALAKGTGISYWNADYTASFGVVLGSESQGLSQFWADNADELIYIPMSHRAVSSLNVSVSGGVVLFEAVRQRKAEKEPQ